MIAIKIGDTVVVNDKAHYVYTVPGSWGIVKDIYGTDTQVRFLGGTRDNCLDTWWVETRHLRFPTKKDKLEDMSKCISLRQADKIGMCEHGRELFFKIIGLDDIYDKKYNIKETLDEAVKRGIDISEAQHWLNAKGYDSGL